MPITINGSGTLAGLTPGGLPDGVITNPDLAADAVSRSKLDADTATGVCQAWVNFNGTGTVAIRASYNVSSITDNGTGDYTVNFTTALVDSNYVTQCTPAVSIQATRSPESFGVHNTYTPSASSVRVYNRLGGFDTSDSIPADNQYCNVVIFR
jgi:hypothetical protein